jgi:hypothetical protein
LEKSTRLDAINFAQHGGFPAQSEPKKSRRGGALTILK